MLSLFVFKGTSGFFARFIAKLKLQFQSLLNQSGKGIVRCKPFSRICDFYFTFFDVESEMRYELFICAVRQIEAFWYGGAIG